MKRSWSFRTSKPLTSLALIGVAVCVPIACAQTVDAWTRTVTLHPVGGDDTVRLQSAFDLCAALGPGCTVQLAAGTFYVGAIVSRGFDGVFAGAGHDVSVLEPLGALGGRRGDGVVTVSAGALGPSTLTFIDADVALVALSVHVPVVHLSSGVRQAAAVPSSGDEHQQRGGGGRCTRTTSEFRFDDGRSPATVCP